MYNRKKGRQTNRSTKKRAEVGIRMQMDLTQNKHDVMCWQREKDVVVVVTEANKCDTRGVHEL